MRKTINISVSPDMHRFIIDQSAHGTVSEYIRSLVRRDRQSAKMRRMSSQMNDSFVFEDALQQLDRLKAILERRELIDE